MDKYTLLIILNAPFIIYGFVKAASMFKKGRIGRLGFGLRIIFWLGIASGLLFARQIFGFLVANHLTDSQSISLADVFLATGVVFCTFLIIRVYAKADAVEARLDELHEHLSILSAEEPEE